jgi:hypothetical protein
MMNKENSLWIKFELLFLFVDLKVILLIVMLFNFYKETVLLADVAKPHLKMAVTDILYGTWERAGSGYWLWIIGAMLGDIVVKSILRKLNE